MSKPKLKAECIRLRVTERLSLGEIHRRTGAAKGSLSAWLKPHPLTEEERAAKYRDNLAKNRHTGPRKDRGEESSLHRLANGGKLTRLQKAKVAESAALLRMSILGMSPFGSVFDGERTDWLVEVPGAVWKIQVKWASVVKRGLPSISLKRSGTRTGSSIRYLAGEFDFIVGYDFYTDTCYVWSWADVEHLKSGVTVCPGAKERWDKLFRQSIGSGSE